MYKSLWSNESKSRTGHFDILILFLFTKFGGSSWLIKWIEKLFTNNFKVFDGLVQDCSNPSALAMELQQSCIKPSIWGLRDIHYCTHLSICCHSGCETDLLISDDQWQRVPHTFDSAEVNFQCDKQKLAIIWKNKNKQKLFFFYTKCLSPPANEYPQANITITASPSAWADHFGGGPGTF